MSESDVIDLLETILAGPFANQILREYIITALMKLTSRFTSTSSSERIKKILLGFTTSIEVEIQQRAAEFTNLFRYDEIRPAILERMPVMEIKETVIAGERLNSSGTDHRYDSCKPFVSSSREPIGYVTHTNFTRSPLENRSAWQYKCPGEQFGWTKRPRCMWNPKVLLTYPVPAALISRPLTLSFWKLQ